MKTVFKLKIQNISLHARNFWKDTEEMVQEWTAKMEKTCENDFETLEEAWLYANLWDRFCEVPFSEMKIQKADPFGEVTEYTYHQALDSMIKVKVVIEDQLYCMVKLRDFETMETIAEIHPSNLLIMMTYNQLDASIDGQMIFSFPENLIKMLDGKPENYTDKFKYDEKEDTANWF